MFNNSNLNEYEIYVDKLMHENEVPGFAVGLSEMEILHIKKGSDIEILKRI